MASSRHGPSTTLHRGLRANLVRSAAWPLRNWYTARAPAGVRSALPVAPCALVLSQAIGSGVTCESSLYQNHFCEYALSRWKAIVWRSRTFVDSTLSGYEPGTYAAHWSLLAVTRFCQNWTSRAVTSSPLDHT
jgi:hypothetical protein